MKKLRQVGDNLTGIRTESGAVCADAIVKCLGRLSPRRVSCSCDQCAQCPGEKNPGEAMGRVLLPAVGKKGMLGRLTHPFPC